jgi:hypothetical protein
MLDVSMTAGLLHEPPAGRVEEAIDVPCSQRAVALPDPSSATRAIDACGRTGETAVIALQLPPAGRVADSI